MLSNHVVASTERAVYFGCKLIGLYVRIGIRRYAAFDEHGVWLGEYKRSSRAQRAIRKLHDEKESMPASGDARRNADVRAGLLLSAILGETLAEDALARMSEVR